jgi:Ca2+-binding EF-hand superfamily protein
VIEAFKLLSESSDNKISKKVLIEIMKATDSKLSESELEELLKGLFEEKEGRGDKEEKMDYVKLVNAVMVQF